LYCYLRNEKISWLGYNLSKTKTDKVGERLYKSDTLQEHATIKLQRLQSQVDSISNHLLSK